MNLILCGLPCSGKTYFGQQLSQKMKCDFFDLDRLIEKETDHLSCREIFLTEGEEAFRKRETRALETLKKCQHSVIALGGGTLMRVENISLISALGTLAYLKTPIPHLLDRLKTKKDLPAYLDPQQIQSSFEKLADLRVGTYEIHSTITINTENLSEREVLLQLIDCFNQINERHFYGQ